MEYSLLSYNTSQPKLDLDHSRLTPPVCSFPPSTDLSVRNCNAVQTAVDPSMAEGRRIASATQKLCKRCSQTFLHFRLYHADCPLLPRGRPPQSGIRSYFVPDDSHNPLQLVAANALWDKHLVGASKLVRKCPWCLYFVGALQRLLLVNPLTTMSIPDIAPSTSPQCNSCFYHSPNFLASFSLVPRIFKEFRQGYAYPNNQP